MDTIELLEKRVIALEGENLILLTAISCVTTYLMKFPYNDQTQALLEKLSVNIDETINRHNVTQMLVSLQQDLQSYQVKKGEAYTGDTTRLSSNESATES